MDIGRANFLFDLIIDMNWCEQDAQDKTKR